jgi:hypothetical protein
MRIPNDEHDVSALRAKLRLLKGRIDELRDVGEREKLWVVQREMTQVLDCLEAAERMRMRNGRGAENRAVTNAQEVAAN